MPPSCSVASATPPKGPSSFGLCLPGLLPLPSLCLCLGLALLGAALGLHGLVAGEGAVGLLGLAHRLVHLPASFPGWVYNVRYARNPGRLHPGPEARTERTSENAVKPKHREFTFHALR